MYTTFVILIVIVSILLCLVVLIQESKGGGLAADYASGNTLLGAPKTTNVIEKATKWLAGIMVALSIISVCALPEAKTMDSVLQMEETAAEAPVLPTVPAATETAETADPTPLSID
jgi:preprotein translocase subunit SecG